MKRIIFIFSFCVFSAIAFSQDYISTYQSERNTDKNTEDQQKELFARKFMSLNNNLVTEHFLMNDKESFFYNDFVKAKRLQKAGKVLWITGAIVTGAGISITGVSYIMTAISAYSPDIQCYFKRSLYTGLLIVAAGGCLIGAGMPLYIVGKNRIKKIKRDYIRTYMNEQAYIPNPSLDFGLTGNGVGLVFNF
jgi:hypothetical protein